MDVPEVTMVLRSVNEIRPRHMTEPGYSKVVSKLLAGPAEGCNKITMKLVTIGPGGHTSRDSVGVEKVHFVISGRGEYVDPDGFAREIVPGDVIVIQPWELHHFQNRTGEDLGFVLVSGQGP
jgi:mannose-6-phosphate isomerase-like protein (cupin superfamily)